MSKTGPGSGGPRFARKGRGASAVSARPVAGGDSGTGDTARKADGDGEPDGVARGGRAGRIRSSRLCPRRGIADYGPCASRCGYRSRPWRPCPTRSSKPRCWAPTNEASAPSRCRVLQRLAKLYDVPVDQLLPQDDDANRWGPAGEREPNGDVRPRTRDEPGANCDRGTATRRSPSISPSSIR